MTNKDDERAQNIMDYLATFEPEAGKRVRAHLRKTFRCDISIIPKDTTGRIDPFAMARSEGQRSVIVHIETMLKKDQNEKRGIKHD